MLFCIATFFWTFRSLNASQSAIKNMQNGNVTENEVLKCKDAGRLYASCVFLMLVFILHCLFCRKMIQTPKAITRIKVILWSNEYLYYFFMCLLLGFWYWVWIAKKTYPHASVQYVLWWWLWGRDTNICLAQHSQFTVSLTTSLIQSKSSIVAIAQIATIIAVQID